MKIFDCSNSIERPDHRGFGGPVENTVMRDLKKYASEYCAEFVTDIAASDVIITNDVFTKEAEIYALDFGAPLVKRMDGVFFQDSLRERNESLNIAARQADLVIFISEFSRSAYRHLYGRLQPLRTNSTVILNWVDTSIFKFKSRSGIPHKFVSVASSWGRQEKRVDDIITLAKRNRSKEFYLIGHCNNLRFSVPPNVHCWGYVEDEDALNSTLSKMDAMICTAYRDAAPKTVAQGVACGLPIFYANSGGVPELVGGNGLGFGPSDVHEFSSSIPRCSNDIYGAFDLFCSGYNEYAKSMKSTEIRYKTLLSSYFEAIRGVL